MLPAPASPLLAALLLAAPAGAVEGPPPDSLVARGEYVFRACDCKACHTDEKHRGKVLAGGRALKTDFGTFYPPNITPDPDTGIGRWSERDFVRSMREGLGRSGENLYPSFPYPAYTRLSDEDLGALWAYLRAQPPVRQENRPHDLHWFARVRPLVGLWKMLYFRAGPQQPADVVQDDAQVGDGLGERRQLGQLWEKQPRLEGQPHPRQDPRAVPKLVAGQLPLPVVRGGVLHLRVGIPRH